MNGWHLRADALTVADSTRSVDLHLGTGGTVGIVGAPGAGKSALGRVLAGLARPVSGVVTVNGHDIADLVGTRAGRSVLRQAVRHVGPDVHGSFEPDRTMRDALRLPLRVLRRVTGTMADVQIDAVLRDLWLDGHLASLAPHELSPAHLRLFALARALVVQPRLVIWDEPADVPAAAQAALLTAFRRQTGSHGTGFLVLSRRLPVGGPALERLVLRDGRLLAAGAARLAHAA